LSLYNREPVGSGPYKLKKLTQKANGSIESITVEPNPYYYGQEPYIQEMEFVFFSEEKDAITAWQTGEIDGFSLVSTDKIQQLKENPVLSLYSYSIPRYFAVFFNLEGSDLMDMKSVREALNYGTDKQKIVEAVLNGNGEKVDSPILPSIYGFIEPKASYQYDPEKAKSILEEAGFKEMEFGPREKTLQKDPSFQFSKRLESGSQGQEVSELQKCLAQFPEIYPEGTVSGYFGPKTVEAVKNFQEEYYEEILKPWGFQSGTGIVGQTTIAKLNEVCAPSETEVTVLKIKLVTVENDMLLKAAGELKKQWEEIGAELEIASYSFKELESEFIKSRNYEAVLIGESLGMIPDPFIFWHSSNVKEPGYNLSYYKSDEADKLLEESRKNLDPLTRAQKLQSFQEVLIKDCPAVFLFSSDYLHLVPSKVKGIEEGVISDPSKRFLNIQEWYIKTKKEWK
jgi:ABC-type transport system substrate-binding protein